MIDLAYTDTPKQTHPCNCKNQLSQTKLQDPKCKWFKSNFTIDKPSKKQEGLNNKLMQSIIVNSLNSLVESYKDVIEDLQQSPKIKNTAVQQQILENRKKIIIQNGLYKVLKAGVGKNLLVQKQYECYSDSYKIATQPSQKQQSIFIKSISTNIELSQISSESNNNPSKMLTMIFPSQVIQRKLKPINIRSLYMSQNNRVNNHREVNQDRKGCIKPIKRSTSPTLFNNQSIFRSRKLKYCNQNCKIMDIKKTESEIEEESIIKFIQSKIQNDSFRLVAPNKTIYKKKMRTFYKG